MGKKIDVIKFAGIVRFLGNEIEAINDAWEEADGIEVPLGAAIRSYSDLVRFLKGEPLTDDEFDCVPDWESFNEHDLSFELKEKE